MLRRNHCLFSLSLFVLSLSLGAETLPTYVVTANRAGEDSMSVPARVTVVSADEIAVSGKTSLVDVLESVAGVSFSSYSSANEAQVSMRGFGENSFGRVLVLVDGRKLNNPDMAGLNWQAIPLSSIDRIEVIDGSAGAAYGSGAVGGVINIVTKESSPGLTAEAEISWGSFNTRQALVNAGYGTDSAGFLVSVDMNKTDGFRERTENSATNVTLNAFADVTDKLTLKPFLTYADLSYEMPGSLSAAQFDDDPEQANNKEDEASERDIGAGLSALFAATDRLSAEVPASYSRKSRATDMPGSYYFADIVQQTFGAMPKVSYEGESGSGPYRITGGFDFEGVLHGSDVYSDEDRSFESYVFDISQFAYAPWLSTTVSLPYKLSATAGVRYDIARISATKEKAKLSATTVGELDDNDDYSAFVYDVSLGYRPIENLSIYVKYNTLFRYPFIDEKAELTGYGLVDRINAELGPETGINFEAGAKYRFGEVLSASATAYYMVMKDEIAYDSNLMQNVNLNTTTRTGGAIDLGLKPVNFLSLDVGASYVRAVLDDSGDDEPVSLVPALTANAGAAVSLPLNVTLGTDVSYTGERPYNHGDDSLDAYALLGATVTVAPAVFEGRLSFTARGENLLDERYASFAGYNDWTSSGYFYPAEGRSFTVSASYRY